MYLLSCLLCFPPTSADALSRANYVVLLSYSTDSLINPRPHSVSALLVAQMSDWSRGLTPAALTSYESGKHCFLTFSSHFSFQPVPLQESTLYRFAAYLAGTFKR